jgi:hypothetical protein
VIFHLLRRQLPKKPAPRPLKYGWAVALSGLVLGSVVNQAIDLLQQQNQPPPAAPAPVSPGR